MTKIKGRTQTGAWIETLTKKSTIHYWTGRTQTGAWIETEMLSDGFFEHFSRTQTGAWIETSHCSLSSSMTMVSPKGGGVD